MHDHHRFPVSRRDFLSQGFLSFAGLTLLPSWLSSKSFADECMPSSTGYIPYLVIDAAGGAAFPGNFLVRGGKGDLLPKYDLLGWDPRLSGAVSEVYGLPMAATLSQIFIGINGTASAEARARFRMGGICHYAQSDTQSNLLSSLGYVHNWGYRGTRLRGATGLVNSASGGNSNSAGPKFDKPLFVRTVKDLTGAVGFPINGPFGSAKPEELRGMLKTASTLSEVELEKWQSLPEGKLLAQSVKCAFKENDSNVSQGGDAFDARKDAQFRQIYQINENSPENLENVVFGSLVKGVLTGATGPSVLTIGDCDYHNNTQTKGDSKDLEIGQVIGRAVQAAHILKKPLFIQLITDGGCSNNPGTRVWRSDDNDKCMTVVGIYRPDSAVSLARTQVGYYNPGQSANLDTLGGLGAKPQKVAATVFANYLRLQNPGISVNEFHSLLNKVVPSDMFTNTKELESCLFMA